MSHPGALGESRPRLSPLSTAIKAGEAFTCAGRRLGCLLVRVCAQAQWPEDQSPMPKRNAQHMICHGPACVTDV